MQRQGAPQTPERPLRNETFASLVVINFPSLFHSFFVTVLLAELFRPELFLPLRPPFGLAERWRHRTLRVGCFSAVHLPKIDEIINTLTKFVRDGVQFLDFQFPYSLHSLCFRRPPPLRHGSAIKTEIPCPTWVVIVMAAVAGGVFA